MRGPLVVVTVALLVAGCATARDRLARACLEGPRAVLTALEQAPGPVALEDGTRLSGCVQSAHTEGDLQSLGFVFVRVADTLRADASARPGAAVRLGYLAGAVKAGAKRSSGSIAAQLARRVEQVASLPRDAGPASAAALERGRAAGERSG